MDFPLERWHPLTVHFPIAFLLLATVLLLIVVFLKRRKLISQAFLLLSIGVVGTWLSVWTGHLADGEVARTLCDPGVLKDHEQYNTVASWLFTVAWLVLFVHLFRNRSLRWRRSLVLVTTVVSLTASVFLVIAAHAGGQLVYQQGAGVNQPSADCSEYD